MKTDNRLLLLDTLVLKDEEIFRDFYEKMPIERKKKIDALKPEGSKRLCLGAGILLDRALREYLSADGSKQFPSLVDYEIATGPQGKPYIQGLPGFSFNLSHSGDIAAIAVSDREVGIDIQKFEHFNDSLVDHVFNIEDKELAKELMAELTDSGLWGDPAQHGDSSFDHVYTRMWTMKESVMKYTGKGLSLEPKKIILKRAQNGKHATKAHTSSIVSYINSNEYSGRFLFIQEFTTLQKQDTFYGISVCSEYEVFTQIPEIIGL
ncbi:MAG: 4'-phosphopantetheinyl transferase superfamily protein [Butyrivibrio sp.]|nr:4'-phosphopantetheinyl transferase superfamily protein [Butyrivibrio sp.]